MTGIVEWIKNYSMVFLLMTVITSAAAKKEYKKYIHLFVEIILVITLANPFLRALNRSEDLFEKISFESFWQGLEEIRMDRDKMDFLNEDYYVDYFEKAVLADVGLMAENIGYTLIDAKVTLNEDLKAEAMELKVAKQDMEPVIIGSVEEEPEKEELTRLREKIASYYQIDAASISIID